MQIQSTALCHTDAYSLSGEGEPLSVLACCTGSADNFMSVLGRRLLRHVTYKQPNKAVIWRPMQTQKA